MFQPYSFLQDSVRERDKRKIRVAISSYLSKNPGNHGGEVTQAIDYAERGIGESLWLPHDGRPMETDRNKWDRELLGRLLSDLRNNFSKERFDFIVEVGKVVKPAHSSGRGDRNTAPPSVSPTREEWARPNVRQSEGANRLGKSKGKWLVIAGLGGLAIVATIVWLSRK